MTSKSRFVSSEGFEVEFLAKLNREGLSCVRLESSGIFAESLSYVELFGSNYIEVERNGIVVKVASPTAYLNREFDAYACEMEGAAIARVCQTYEKPFVIMRTLSDKADGKAHESYVDFIQTAAGQSNAIVLQMLESL